MQSLYSLILNHLMTVFVSVSLYHNLEMHLICEYVFFIIIVVCSSSSIKIALFIFVFIEMYRIEIF